MTVDAALAALLDAASTAEVDFDELVANPPEPFAVHGDLELFDPCDQHGYFARRVLPDGRMLGCLRLIYTTKLVVASRVGSYTYDDGWCYDGPLRAVAAMAEWDGEGEPDGWHRHPSTGRRRPDGDAAREYVSP